jgi:hypothetical protein
MCRQSFDLNFCRPSARYTGLCRAGGPRFARINFPVSQAPSIISAINRLFSWSPLTLDNARFNLRAHIDRWLIRLLVENGAPTVTRKALDRIAYRSGLALVTSIMSRFRQSVRLVGKCNTSSLCCKCAAIHEYPVLVACRFRSAALSAFRAFDSGVYGGWLAHPVLSTRLR